MNEKEVRLHNSEDRGFGFRVRKSGTHKGGLVITEVCPDSPAGMKNLKVGDHIIRVNNKSTKSNRTKLISEINESKPESLFLVIKSGVKESRHQSYMNLSSSICSINNNLQTSRNSKSSIDLNYSYQPPKKIIDSNFIPEDQIKNFIQDDSSTGYGKFSEISEDKASNFFNDKSLASFDDSDSTQSSHIQSNSVSPSPSTVQVTRKQAYKKSNDETDNIYQSQQPRINRKKATNTININNKDPVVTVKKKINPSVDGTQPINRNSSTNLHSRKKFSATPVPKTLNVISGNISNSNLVNSYDSPNSYQICSTMYDTPDGLKNLFKRSPNQPKETPPMKETVPSRSQIELEMKITSFKEEKIVKPGWKKYWLEQDYTGVYFEYSDFTKIHLSSNSTALNPAIANPDLIMNLWKVNNTITRFYLPIGQSPFDENINRFVTPDEIKISYMPQKLEFVINFSKLNEEIASKLFKMLKVSPPEVKMPVAKHKKSITTVDPIRLEPRKSKQPPKPVTEKLLLSSLHKTTKVEEVPLVVIICVTLIEEMGLKEEGIYRKCGNLAGKRLLEDVIANESPDKWSIHEEWNNVNTTSNFFKSFLRKYTLLDKDTAIKLSTIKLDMVESTKYDTDKKVQDIMDMIYHLTCNFKSASFPEENKCRLDTFKYIIKHLYRVHLCQEYTKMNAENLATCFVPNLIEDIPVEDDAQYKDSRKNVAHEYLTKMVTFWITYADTMCELLEEEKEDELNKKVINFLSQKNLPYHDNAMKINKDDIDFGKLVKERIEFYTEDVTITTSSSSPNNVLSVSTPESYFSRTKNSRPYQSVKQSRTNKNRRRNNSGSSVDLLKLLDINKLIDGNKIVQKNEIKNQMGSPTNYKKFDMWIPRNLRKNNKEMSYGNNLDIQMTSLLISDNKKDTPLVVTVCITIIETFGLKVDGIYRISGRNQDINNLDSLVMKNETDKWIEESNIKIWANMHNTACLMKKVLKKFRLIPKDTWMHMTSQFSEKLEPEDVKNVLKAAAYYLRVEETKSSTGKISSEEKNDIKDCEIFFSSGTLRYVLKHLQHVSWHESDNRMSSNSLAVCFVPVLMEEDYSSDMVVLNTKCIQIVQLLIDHCQWIFQWDFKPSEDLYGQKMSDSLNDYLRDYKPISCNCADQKESNFIADYDNTKQILDQLIQSSYHLEEFVPNNLRTFFENSYFSVSKSENP